MRRAEQTTVESPLRCFWWLCQAAGSKSRGRVCPRSRSCGPTERSWTPSHPRKSANHSPTGFKWGYSGSGPSQLALTLLLDYILDQDLPMDEDLRDPIGKEAAVFDEEGEVGIHRFVFRYYHDFKRQYVALWDDEWELPAAEIGSFLRARLYHEGLVSQHPEQ